jgi:hypothetical protein
MNLHQRDSGAATSPQPPVSKTPIHGEQQVRRAGSIYPLTRGSLLVPERRAAMHRDWPLQFGALLALGGSITFAVPSALGGVPR